MGWELDLLLMEIAMLKRTCLIATMIISPAVLAGNSTSGKDYCAIKKEKIQQQIEYAKQYNNPHRVAGLQRALSNVETYCTNEGYRADNEERIAKKERKVAEREAELREAKASGRSDKIAKKQRKLREAESELEEALERL